MSPEEPLLPEDSPELPSRSASLDPSEQEALLRHLSRYQVRKVRRRQGHKPLLAAGTVVAGAAVILVVVGLARSPRPDAPPSLSTPADETEAVAGRTVSPPPAGADKTVAASNPGASTATPSGRETDATPAAPARPASAAREAPPPSGATSAPAAPTPPKTTAPAPTAPRGTAPTVVPPAPTSSPATRPSPGAPATAPGAPSSPGIAVVAYQPRERLALVSAGDTKDKVFDRFGTTFEQRGGSVVRIDGMRLRASGRSPRHAQVEVAEVTLADAAGGRVHWFLFGDGRLLAWGRPEEWPATVQSHAVEIDYPPAARSGR